MYAYKLLTYNFNGTIYLYRFFLQKYYLIVLSIYVKI